MRRVWLFQTLFLIIVLLSGPVQPVAVLRPGPARADVTPADVFVVPNTAGDPAAYTINFNVGAAGALTANVSTISITFPSDTTVPSSISRSFVAVNGTPLNVDPAVIGRTVILITPVAVGNNGAVTVAFSQPAGLVNPTLAGTTYTVSVSTSVEPASVTSRPYTITRKLSQIPTSGARGTRITLMGVGWAPNTTVEVYRDADGNGRISPVDPRVGEGTVGSDGQFSLSVVATVPPFQAGANILMVRDGSGATVNTTFRVTPSLGTPSPTSRRIGGSVTIPMWDFAARINGAMLAVTVGGGTAVVTSALPAVGTSPISVTFTVPLEAPIGAVQVVVTWDPDGAGATAAQSATTTLFVTLADVSLTPSSGPNRTTVNIWVTGLTPNSYIGNGDGVPPGGIPGPENPHSGIFFSGVRWNAIDVLIDSSGAALVALPISTVAGDGANAIPQAGTPGTYNVRVVDNAGVYGTATFTIPERSLFVDPPSSQRGSPIYLTGRHFSVNSTVHFAYGGTPLPGVSATTDLSGNFTATITVPTTADLPSENNVVATDAFGLSASAMHRVSPASITLSPTSGPPGTHVVVRGAGFPSFTPVFLSLDGLVVTPSPTPVTDAHGAFETTIVVPALPFGLHFLTAVAGGVVARANFTVAPPSADLSVAMVSIPDRVVVGGELTYIIVATNFGPQSASDVKVVGILPEGLATVSVQSNRGSCTIEIGMVECRLATLPVLETVRITLRLSTSRAGLFINRGTASAVENDPNPGDNIARAVTVVIAGPPPKGASSGAGGPDRNFILPYPPLEEKSKGDADRWEIAPISDKSSSPDTLK